MVMCLIVSAVSAQQLHYGIKANLNILKLDGKGIEDNYTLDGGLGVYGYCHFTK